MDVDDELLAIEQIHQLKARYFRCVDTKDWDGFRAVFAEDLEMDVTDDDPNGLLRGADAAVEFARTGLAGCQSVHHGHCPEIEILSDTTARGTWAMEDQLFWSDQSPFPGQELHGMGHYHETYEKIDGRWVIRTMQLRRLHRVFTPAATDG